MNAAGPIDAPLGQSAVPSAADTGGDHPDPHGITPLVSQLDPSVLDARRSVLLIAAAALNPGERVYGILAGRFLGHVGIALLTSERVLAINARHWKPSLAAVPLTKGLAVETWRVDDTLTLRFSYGDQSIVIDGIGDHDGGSEFAAAVRSLAV